MRVVKFGGTSVGSAERMTAIVKLLEQSSPSDRVCLAASAIGGVTNLLLNAARTVQAGEAAAPHVSQLRSMHADLVADLEPELDEAARTRLSGIIDTLCADFERLLQGISLLHEASPLALARISSLGERLSCSILFELARARGLEPRLLDPCDYIIATGDPLEATPDMHATRERFAPLRASNERLLILPGFFAGDRQGRTVLLGRGGSDWTAAIAASALDARICEIWTDVDGIYSADPRIVPEAFPLGETSFEEAMELSYFGAKVLHPKTIQPARDRGIPVVVRNSFKPDLAGTVITRDAKPAKGGVRGLTLLRDVALVNFTGTGITGIPGVASRAFGALGDASISAILISQASSECAISMCVAAKDGARAVAALERAFDLELRAHHIDPIESRSDLAILSVVGDGMRTRMGAAGTFFDSLAEVGVNVVAIAQSASERSISAVVGAGDGERALRHAHHRFFGTPEALDLFLFGVGSVGTRLLDQVSSQRERLRKRGVDVRIVGVANSRWMVLDVRGIDPAKAKAEIHGPAAVPVSLDGIADFVARERLVTPVLVDCTANAGLSHKYAAAMEAGLHVVTANKIANSSGLEGYRELRRVARRKQRRFLYETNVGAGLPVISTLQTLVQRGDRVLRIEGVLSGSMSYLLGRLEEGVLLSHAVREAKEKGFTEPDPRDDLSGRDVARKVLILAREVGLDLEPHDVVVNGVLELAIDAKSAIPMRLPALFSSEGSVDEFFDALPSLDGVFAQRVADLAARGMVLRFVGTIEDGRASVGLRAVDADHPLRGVKGGENALAFLTEHYSPRPMVIRGYGAGAEVTAAGVLADILSLASWSGA